MKMRILPGLVAISAFISGGVFGQADDVYPVLKTRDGNSYTNARISSVTAAYATVWYGNGDGARIPLSEMPEAVQQKYGYDPAKADAEIAAHRETVKAQEEARKDRLLRFVDGQPVAIANFTNLRGKVAQVLPDGILFVPNRIIVKHVAPIRPKLNDNQRVGIGYVPPAVATEEKTEVPGDQTVFVKCPTKGIVDGQEWDALCYLSGTYSNPKTDGTKATIQKYDTGLSYLTKSDAILRQPKSVQKRVR
jgi:hypothetical protein